MTVTSLLLHKLWTCDVEEFCCCTELTAAHVCFIQTVKHLSAVFMTVVDWQFFSSLLCYVQHFSRISKKNVGSQPNFSHICTYRNNSDMPNISRNLFPAIQNFKKIRFGVYPQENGELSELRPVLNCWDRWLACSASDCLIFSISSRRRRSSFTCWRTAPCWDVNSPRLNSCRLPANQHGQIQ